MDYARVAYHPASARSGAVQLLHTLAIDEATTTVFLAGGGALAIGRVTELAARRV